MNLLSKLDINSKEDFYRFVKQFTKFGMVGVLNSAISLGIYYAFVVFNPTLYIIGNTVGFVVSVLNAYYWNNKYVFQKSEQGHLKTISKTFMAYGGTFVLSTALLYVMVEYLGISKVFAPIINLIITIPLNFLINKFWAFKVNKVIIGDESLMTSKELAWKIRRDAIEMTHISNGSHIGSILSIADIVAVLYATIMQIYPDDPANDKRDRLILSKGHAGAAVYSALAESGFFPTEELLTHYANGSHLSGHVSHLGVPGVEFSTGSLGHGVCIAAGMAMAAKYDRKNHRIFAIIGDGECDEGSVWEMALFANQSELSNLTVIVDHNKIQGLDYCENIMKLSDLAQKWKAFGWNVLEIDGHNHEQLVQALIKQPTEKPTCVIAHTTKGKGISFMEDKIVWHYRAPQGDDYIHAVEELEENKE